MNEIKMTEEAFEASIVMAAKTALKRLLDRHEQSRTKISSQCDTLISKKLVEDMIKELE